MCLERVHPWRSGRTEYAVGTAPIAPLLTDFGSLAILLHLDEVLVLSGDTILELGDEPMADPKWIRTAVNGSIN